MRIRIARPDLVPDRAATMAAGAVGAARSGSELYLVHRILRLAVAACFVGHGAFGIITKAAWVPYFALVGIPEWLAWPLMPVVGTVDIALGALTLVRPMRAVLLYMAVWGFWTALLRPLAGEGIWELLERAGNFGIPLAFLLFSGPAGSVKEWFSAVGAPTAAPARAARIAWALRLTTAALLIGHGGFGAFMEKAAGFDYFGAVAVTRPTVEAAALIARIGWFEIALGLLALAWPAYGVLVFAFVWKVATELLRPAVGEPFWEFIERGGSYAAPLALALLYAWMRSQTADGLASSRPQLAGMN